ncbi:hypothetical protein Aspvir_007873 [Aspergillus viridinutans]|uniref:Uncharacterized protein n=1 Tax=Aspergillus viridinutans TaxID=75553 RepID=A0A9P3BX16_ASPVI|nr:uncharacterized protein Aspvir_007873 [Aspergillus viridinutans]GIK03799.1 hypothetical protein Aspvir_007873 [Aspergillus viridinutans]
MQVTENKSVAIIGGTYVAICSVKGSINKSVAGIFGLSLAVALRSKGYTATICDRNEYDKTGYDPEGEDAQAASVDLNKIVSLMIYKEVG